MSESTTTTREHLPAVTEEPAQTPAPAPAQPTIPEDPDDRALFEARAEVERSESGQGQAPAPAAPAQRPAARQQQRPAPQGEAMVPAGRLAEARRSARALADENLYLKGALAARTAQPVGTPQPAAPQQPNIAQQIQAEGQRIIDAAKKFDQGELSLEQFKQIELGAEDKIASLRAHHLLNHVQNLPAKGTASVGIADQQVLDQHIERMSVEHPWSAELNDQEIDWLAQIARDEFRGLGRPIVPGNAMDTLRLRQAVAELSDTYGPRWYPNAQVAQPQQQQPAPRQTQQPAGPRVQQTARLVDVAARQPPSLSQAGHADSGEASLTTDKMAAMSEEEILALPRAVRDRYLYGA